VSSHTGVACYMRNGPAAGVTVYEVAPSPRLYLQTGVEGLWYVPRSVAARRPDCEQYYLGRVDSSGVYLYDWDESQSQLARHNDG
jgi:hypothetical protein